MCTEMINEDLKSAKNALLKSHGYKLSTPKES